MKKNLFFVMAAGAMLFATSCQNDLDIMGNVGDEALVSFNVTTTEMVTRVYSDGLSAQDLQYAVYDANGNHLEKLNGQSEINLTANVELSLTTGNTYTVIFWADNSAAPYKVDFAAKTMTIDYDGVACNNENLDAFFAKHTFTVTGAQSETVVLKRPFAQLNIGTADYIDSENAGYVPTQSAVTVKNVYNTLNLWNGEVSGDDEVAYALADIKKDEAFPVAGYEYLAMNYLLVEKETVEVEFTYTDGASDKTRTVGSVPVQRNYRTNIYGKLLTSNVDVTVTIDPIYDGDLEPDALMVNNANELQAALDAAPVGETTICLAQDIEGDVIEFQKADRNIVILGAGNKYNGTIKIHSGSNYNNGTITIKDVNFETSTPDMNFIMPNDFGVENGVTRRYSNNVIVEGCTFTATGAAENTVVGVQAKSCNNVQVIDCTATGLHSLIQAQSCGTDVIVKDCTIDGKNGVAFKQVKAATVENTTIVADAYGIRFDGNTANYGIVAKDINVTAVQPFIVRKMTGANNTITLQGNNTLVSDSYQIVITNGSDDQAYSTPTGTYTLTGATNFFVYPNANEAAVALKAAIADNTQSEVALTEAVSSPGIGFEVERDVVFNFNNQVLNAGSDANSRWYALEIYGDNDVVINDANFTRAGVFAADGADVVFNSGVINHNPERTSRYIFCAQSGSTITVKNGTFKNDREKNSYFWADNATIIVEGGNFEGVASKNKVVLTNNGQLIVKGGTFNFDPTAYVAAGYVATKNGSTWTVSAE